MGVVIEMPGSLLDSQRLSLAIVVRLLRALMRGSPAGGKLQRSPRIYSKLLPSRLSFHATQIFAISLFSATSNTATLGSILPPTFNLLLFES